MKFILTGLFIIIFIHISSAENWQLVGFEDYDIEHVYVNGDTLWVSTMDSIYKSEVFYSFNGGDIWQKVADADTLINGWLKLLRVSPYKSTEIYAHTLNGRGLKSVDGGQSWEILFPDLEPWPPIKLNVKEIHVSPHSKNTIFGIVTFGQAGFFRDNLFHSIDRGKNWEPIETGFPSSSHGSTFTIALDPIDSLKMYAAVSDEFSARLFYVSTNNGAQWTFRSSLDRSTLEIIPNHMGPDTIFVFPAAARSVDNGHNWNRVLEKIIIPDSLFQPFITSSVLSKDGSKLLVSITKPKFSLGIFEAIDGGDNWSLLPGSENLNLNSSHSPHILFIDPITNKLYVGTKQGLYAYNLVTSIDEKNYNPKEFKLHQNYPNPFNPITKIDYRLAMNSRATLKIYDMAGRIVNTLVNQQQNAGEHSATFDAGNMPSGVYFYRLTTSSGFSQTRKMILLK